MGWFRRKPQDKEPEPLQVAEVEPEPWLPAEVEPEQPSAPMVPLGPQSVVRYEDDGNLSINIGNVAEAKQAIKELKLIKKEWAIEKKAINAEIADLRAGRRMQTAQQSSMVRGGGQVGQVVRSFQRISRDEARRNHANALAPLEESKAFIDRSMLEIDSAVTQLEGYILRNQG